VWFAAETPTIDRMSIAVPALGPGRRSARGVAAIVAALAALAPLPLIRFAGASSISGGGQVGRMDYEYTLGEVTTTAIAVSVVLAVMIAVGAAGLWAARDRRLLALTVAVGLAGGIATPVVVERQSGSDPVSAAEHRAVPLGIDHGELEDRLGRPAGSGTATTPKVPGARLECAVYTSSPLHPQRLYCFHDDRLVLKVNG
jgi:hypothetical protein